MGMKQSGDRYSPQDAQTMSALTQAVAQRYARPSSGQPSPSPYGLSPIAPTGFSDGSLDSAIRTGMSRWAPQTVTSIPSAPSTLEDATQGAAQRYAQANADRVAVDPTARPGLLSRAADAYLNASSGNRYGSLASQEADNAQAAMQAAMQGRIPTYSAPHGGMDLQTLLQLLKGSQAR